MPKGFCILRVEKIKSASGVAVALGHNLRERETVNADPDLKKRNQIEYSKTVSAGMARFRGLVAKDENVRKNAVLCLDYMISASNKSLGAIDRTNYLNDALKWIRDRHGDENILQLAVHRDENTDAHMHVLVVPLALNKHQKPKLSASKWLDGRKKLSEMQTEFARDVGSKHDLGRGIEGSVAKHEKVKRFYGLVQKAGNQPKIDVPHPPKLGLFADLKGWQKQASKLVFEQIKPEFEVLDARSRKLNLTEKELNDTKRTLYKATTENQRLAKENRALRNMLENSPLDQIQEYRAGLANDREHQNQQKTGLGRK